MSTNPPQIASLPDSQLLLECLPDAVLLVNDEGTIIKANRLAHQLFGFAGTDLTGRSIDGLLPAGMREAHRAHRAGYHRSPYVRPMGTGKELRAVRRDGTEFPVEISLSPLTTPAGLLVVAVVRNISERKHAEAALLESREQLRQLSGYLQKAREEERTLVAREIHDALGQALTALKMDLATITDMLGRSIERADAPALTGRLASMDELIDSTVQTVRKISSQLRPVLLDSLGLVPAIEWQMEEFQNRTNLRCSVQLPAAEFDLEPERSTAVFRILQETLTNIARHARATDIDMRLRVEEKTLYLDVKDNGRGISASDLAKTGSFGVLGMRERALMFGGELAITRAPDCGTLVSLRMPIVP